MLDAGPRGDGRRRRQQPDVARVSRQAVAEGEVGARVLQRAAQLGVSNPVLRPLHRRGRQERTLLQRRSSRPASPSASATTRTSSLPKLPVAEGVAARGQRSDGVPPGLHHLRRRPVRRHDVLVPARGLRARRGDDVVRQRLAPRRRAGRLHDLRRPRRARGVPRAAGPRDRRSRSPTSSATSPCTRTSRSTAPARTAPTAPLGVHRRHAACGCVLERLAVPELRPQRDEASGSRWATSGSR